MSRHALHSPNITAAEIAAYYAIPLPERNRHSLIEVSNHDPELLKFLSSPLDGQLIRELVKSAASVIPMPKNTHSTLTPPATPAKGTFAQQQQQQLRSQPFNPADVPLEKFVAMMIKNSKATVRTLVYALLVLDRLREKLPPMAQGMACSGHRIFLAALVVASKYINDCTPKNKHWAHWTRYIFQVEEITLMEKQLLGLLQFDLHLTEARMVQRLQPLFVEQPEPKPTGLTVNSRQHIPLTPITPTSNVATVAGVNAIVEPKPGVASMARRELARLETAKSFVLQPVPTLKKRSDKNINNEQAPTMALSTSHSAPSKIEFQEPKLTVTKSSKPFNGPYLALPVFSPINSEAESFEPRVPSVKRSVAMPITRSVSSDGALEGASSSSMNLGHSLSSTTSFSMTNSSSISTSASGSGSEVATPGDRNGDHISTSSQQGKQGHFPNYNYSDYCLKPRRRGSDPVINYMSLPAFGVDGGVSESARTTNNSSGLMHKLLGVGKSLSPTRRIGHGVKGGDRKVSTATIVPDEVHVERQ